MLQRPPCICSMMVCSLFCCIKLPTNLYFLDVTKSLRSLTIDLIFFPITIDCNKNDFIVFWIYFYTKNGFLSSTLQRGSRVQSKISFSLWSASSKSTSTQFCENIFYEKNASDEMNEIYLERENLLMFPSYRWQHCDQIYKQFTLVNYDSISLIFNFRY